MTLEERLAIAARLEELTARGGGTLTPDAVVEDARDEQSPLHDQIFRQSDAEAAHAHRLELARRLIRSVRVNITVDHRTISVVGYVHDPSASNTAGYVQTAKLVNERDRAAETIRVEFERVKAGIERSRELADALNLRKEFEAMLAGVQELIQSTLRAA